MCPSTQCFILAFFFQFEVFWTLVRFKDDNIVSDPIKLHILEDEETGEDGVTAKLEEGDYCMAPYGDSNFYVAKILRISGMLKTNGFEIVSETSGLGNKMQL